MVRPLFQLPERLLCCAEKTRPCACVADIGSDHALLPIWLIRMGKAERGIASDLREGPLAAARKNAALYQVADRLETRLSDGFSAFAPGEVQDIVIAGMGGELILRMLQETPWLAQKEIRLVLQPMSSIPKLRRGLHELGFRLVEEEAVTEREKVYTVMTAVYGGRSLADSSLTCQKDPDLLSSLALYMGKLLPGSEGADRYAEKVLRGLEKERAGLAGATGKARDLPFAEHRGTKPGRDPAGEAREGRIRRLTQLMEEIEARYLRDPKSRKEGA